MFLDSIDALACAHCQDMLEFPLLTRLVQPNS